MEILQLPIISIPLGLLAIFTYLLFGGVLIHVIVRSIMYPFNKDKRDFSPLKQTIKFYNRDKNYMFLSKKYVVIYIVGLIWGIIMILPYTPYGSEQIGSLIEKREYKSFYYVNIFREGEETKNYRVRGMIYSYVDSEFGRKYFLDYVSNMDNGKELYFEPDESLVLNEKVSLIDEHDNYWDVELTEERFPIEKLR
jgi:hypothetical protein